MMQRCNQLGLKEAAILKRPPSMELICPIRAAGTQRFRATGTDRGVGLLDVLRCRNYAAAMLLQYIPANTRAWLGV